MKITPFGTWKVSTTVGDETEKREYLGTYTGNVDDIAFALADKCRWELLFEPVAPLDLTPKKRTVPIRIYDKMFDPFNMCYKEHLCTVYSNFFAGRPVRVEKRGGFGVVTITTDKNTVDEIKAEALGKLTPQERIVLGLSVD